MQSNIAQVRGFRVWDSRGRPTVEVEVTLQDGSYGRGMAPAGASRGSGEATDLRDGGPVFGGFDVQVAIQGVNGEIASALHGLDAREQTLVDHRLVELDGTATKSRLGGNALVATSMAVSNAAAHSLREPLWRYLAQGAPVSLPLPQIQIFGGGAHAGRRVDVQDFMVVPVGAESFAHALEICAEVYRAAGELMAGKGCRAGVADEGGWWPQFASNEEALETLTDAIAQAGFGPDSVAIALDIAASEFGHGGRYRLGLESADYDTDGWLEVLARWIDTYPIVSVEDPVAEDDEAGMRKFTQAFGSRLQIVGDDYVVTNAGLITRAAADHACNTALIKLNQAGTLTETRVAFEAARATGWATIISARSGETEDTFITHLAVGWNAGQLKVGSFARSERMAKWNEGLRIERARSDMRFAGRAALAQFTSQARP